MEKINKYDLINYKNVFIIGADKEKGSYFHTEWDSEEFDLLKILEYIKQQFNGRMGD